MPLLGFKDRFVPAVENGLAEIAGQPPPHPGLRPKRQTIRKARRDGLDPRPGQMLYLYEKARTPEMRKLGEARCKAAIRLRIHENAAGIVVAIVGDSWPNRRNATLLARADGFGSFDELVAFVEEMHGLPFDGVIVRW